MLCLLSVIVIRMEQIIFLNLFSPNLSEDASSGTPEWIEETRLEGHSDWVRDVAWAPSLNVARQLIASCGQDGRVIVWQSISNAEASSTLAPTSNMPIGPMSGATPVTTASGTMGSTGGAAGAQPTTTNLDPKDYVQCHGATNWRPVVLATYPDVVWHVSWSLTGNILAVSGGDNKVSVIVILILSALLDSDRSTLHLSGNILVAVNNLQFDRSF